MPTDPTPTEREMPDDEVDFMLTGYLNPTWEFVRVGDEEYWRDPAGKRWGMEEYCSPDAPVSLRIEMVDAVVKAGKWHEFFCSAPFEPDLAKHGEGLNKIAFAAGLRGEFEEGMVEAISFCALVVDQGQLARKVLAALESAGRGGEK